MVFSGGPATQGPGLVVSEDLRDPLRTHHELQKESAKHVNKATKYYDDLALRAARNGHAVDVFSCALDQTGSFCSYQDDPAFVSESNMLFAPPL
jgi:protein transport protein SEC23